MSSKRKTRVTEENKDTEKEESSDPEIKPPMPDVPAQAATPSYPPPEPKPEPAPASPSAQMKMAGEIESGGTPYNYSGALEEDRAPVKKPVRSFSMTNVLALTAVGALIVLSVVGWRIMETVSVKIDGVNSNVERLTQRLLLESRLANKSSRAVIRAELQKSLKSIEHLIATGDPLVKTEAIMLKNEIREVMALLAARPVGKQNETEDRAESAPEPEPAGDVEAPLAGGEEEAAPGSPENMEQERSDEAQGESAQPL